MFSAIIYKNNHEICFALMKENEIYYSSYKLDVIAAKPGNLRNNGLYFAAPRSDKIK